MFNSTLLVIKIIAYIQLKIFERFYSHLLTISIFFFTLAVLAEMHPNLFVEKSTWDALDNGDAIGTLISVCSKRGWPIPE